MTGLDGFAELTLESDDPDGLARFYCQAFGCEPLSREDGRVWLKVGRQVHFAFRVGPGTLDLLAARVRGVSATVKGPVEHDGGDRSLYVEDPEGNVVEAWDFFDGEGEAEDVAALGES